VWSVTIEFTDGKWTWAAEVRTAPWEGVWPQCAVPTSPSERWHLELCTTASAHVSLCARFHHREDKTGIHLRPLGAPAQCGDDVIFKELLP
jgi:hypothetical protein